MYKYLLIFCISMGAFSAVSLAEWGKAPDNWGDIRFGLVNDNTSKINQRMKQVVGEGAQLMYRYRYINGGFDSTSNAMSWMFTPWTDYVEDSDSLAGVRPSFVIYMLQEEGGSDATIANVMDREKMQMYFANIRSIATRCNGYQSVFVIEPDTWGYLMQDGYMDPEAIAANVTGLGTEFDYLQGLPDNLCGIAQGIIRTIHTFAPDAYAGVLASHWSVNTQPGWHVDGLVWSTMELIDDSVEKNSMWFGTLLGTGPDRGDFIGVEKNGWSAGRWKAQDPSNTRWYWGDEQMVKYIYWCENLGKGLDLPILGWQISIGHMGLPNITVDLLTDNAYEDTFFPYFFEHVGEFIDAGFIGFLVGKGLTDDTDFANETEGEVGDRGWFFNHIKEFDRGRPYLTPTAITDEYITVSQKKLPKGITVIQKNNSIIVAMPYSKANTLCILAYTMTGKLISTIYNGSYTGPSLEIPLYDCNLSSGMYLLRITFGKLHADLKLNVF